jgi:NTE family protein
VSWGSILSAWVALHGVEALEGFEQAFLRRSFQDALVSLALSPRNLWRIQSPRFGRGDLLAEILDERLFSGATFSQLSRTPRKPFVVLYAADMTTGARFEFVQDQFDAMCSDLDGVSLSRAVAASSAVPIVLSPLTFWNHAHIDAPMPVACGDTAAPSNSAQIDITLNSSGMQPYVHVLDGGLADNVGARGPTDYIERSGGVVEGTRRAGYRGVKRVLFIMVNAETSASAADVVSANVPGPLRAALALADIPINRNSMTALEKKRATLQRWQTEVMAAHARGEFDVFDIDARFYLVEIGLADEPDTALRERLLAIPTNLNLPSADVDLLKAHGKRVLKRSQPFNRMLQELKDSP